MEIQYQVKNENCRGIDYMAIYAEFSHIEHSIGVVETKQLYAQLYKVGNVIVWMHPLKDIPVHVFKTDKMNVAIEQAKEIIGKHIVERYS